MIAKIGRSCNLFGTLSYNNSKMEQDKGEILMTNKMIETADGKYSVAQLARSFEPYLVANRNTEKHTLHISLNPDPKDKVSDEKYRELAQLYMNEMGYGNQPFIVFKHTDIDRSHIHIVSVCVDEEGKKISDQFEKIRSMKVCRELEKKFGLISAVEKQPKQNQKIFQPIDYKSGDIKSQIASVIRHIPSYYQFQSLGEYNALLSLFNIIVEKVEGELQGQLKRGLLYFPLDNHGKKAGNPFKASLFGKNAGIDALQKHFIACKNKSNDQLVKQNLKRSITEAHHSSKDEQAFKNKLKKEGIDTVVRKNDNGRIYGITFIDHGSKTVWNGSRLGKEFSANMFNDRWNNNSKLETKEQFRSNDMEDLPTKMPLHLFEVLNTEKQDDLLIGEWVGLLPELQGEDYEELDFANKMKKKRKRRRKQ
ncbi:relaxase/mobilization nuclease domain-containing protein [Chryseobacterium sp. LC2016-29]|uniref:conjugal transfer protein MobB n=1 Tax=Chryseobacterium sp. LC2016-29 TaxID=2897331 RepID=UPI001E608580|nr:conjugal transfer protein MobB [Chryseobacterium sp. LC2016-29]MCD0477815.1 relaxase/mobilization nuclease domain-containing protein [Chryseobacterium sp. LC2016-29]